MSRTFGEKMKALLIIGLLGAGIIAAGILIGRPTSEEREFSGAYKTLEIGMDAIEVEENFGRPPGFKCTFRGSLIQYYTPPPPRAKWFDFRGDIDRTRYTEGAEIKNLKEIPDPYDHVAVAYDPDGKVIAYTYIGEAYNIHTKARGPVKGSSLFHLQPSDFSPTETGAEQPKSPKP